MTDRTPTLLDALTACDVITVAGGRGYEHSQANLFDQPDPDPDPEEDPT